MLINLCVLKQLHLNKHMFNQTTLYYFFSTIAQVIAAAVALIAVLVHFRISALREFLIGAGKSILNGKTENREGYEILNNKYHNRLMDSVSRNDIGGIKDVLKCLSDIEKKDCTIEVRPKGFHWLLNQFEITENQIDKMLKTSKRSFVFALITSGYSILAILFVELVINNMCGQIILIGIDIILLVICGTYLIIGIHLSFKNFTNRFNS